MGVTGLWEVVQPCARPIKIDTLNKKRLAIDASIWVYHFLKAVRDKEGNALRNSHVVGFYRRICKLLFFGIKPVFVFDGGAPALKRQTITGRKARREGRREDATRTAGKLLALQMQRAAEEEEERQKREAERPSEQDDNEEAIPENPVYVDELQMTQQERQQNRKFRKKDQYHLPDLSMSMAEMGGPSDPRVMSLEELQQYAKQFETGEDINVYDFSKIDFDSPFFTSLPASDRYNILNAARLRSRLRMGYSKDQLEVMFPNRMEFSRFQIERVRERNELTQRLMQVGTPEDGMFADAGGRVAGEKGREYVLVRNPDVEGGWALGVIGDKEKEEGQREKPIDIEEKARQAARQKAEEEQPEPSSNSEDEQQVTEEIQKRREAFYKSRRQGKRPSNGHQGSTAAPQEDENSLFVAEDNIAAAQASSESEDSEDEEARLQIAIAMSLESADDVPVPEKKRAPKLPKQQRAPQTAPFAHSKGSVASIANARAHRAAPKPAATTNVEEESDSEGDTMDFQGALAESRQSKYRSKSPVSPPSREGEQRRKQSNPVVSSATPQQKSSGPLPFEKLDLGTSLLGKKKMKQIEEDSAGGFVKDSGKQDDEDSAKPAPPWFAGDVEKGMDAQREIAAHEREQARQAAEDEAMFRPPAPRLRKEETNEIIDLDATDEGNKDPIIVESSEDEDGVDAKASEQMEDAEVIDPEIRFGDMAERVRVEPPEESQSSFVPTPADKTTIKDTADAAEKKQVEAPPQATRRNDEPGQTSAAPKRGLASFMEDEERSDEEVEWEASDHEDAPPAKRQKTASPSLPTGTGEGEVPATTRSPSADDMYIPDEAELEQWGAGQGEGNLDSQTKEREDNKTFHQSQQSPSKGQSDRSPTPEDLYIPTEADLLDGSDQVNTITTPLPSTAAEDASPTPPPATIPASGTAHQAEQPHPANFDVDLPFSDNDSDDDLMASLAAEAEEHARFTSNFNTKTPQQNIADYEAELKALRSQQKKDRRDADEVTTIMIQECQQLLRLFGLPYITAPMEAEAQCAELVALGLVDGIVTDDSDIFLFGGTRIYKNMFNQAKFVECYLASDLERDFDLTRRKMIAIAHLLGSDYTEGIPGVGPVTALEILTEFPEGLGGFREWFQGLQQGNTLTDEDKKNAFKKKFKKQATKLFLPPSFPDQRVDLAYLKPEVDADPSTFQWGLPDLDALRSFLMATIGWTPDRTDEVLVPVIRDMNRRENEGTQANITAFLGGNQGVGAGAFAPRVRAEGKSRRMEAALEKMAERARSRKRGVVGDKEEEAIIARSGSAVDGTAGMAVPKRREDVDGGDGGAIAKGTTSGGKKAKTNGRAADGEDEGDDDSGSAFEEEKPKRKSKGKGRHTKQTKRKKTTK